MLQLTLIVVQFFLVGLVTGTEYKRVCYFTNWAQYRPGAGTHRVEDIPLDYCTHIMFAFAGLKDGLLQTTEWNDDASYKEVVGLKNQRPQLKVMLSVGGATAPLTEMTKMLQTQASRDIFIKSCVSEITEYGFDGIDLDFEFPGQEPSIKEDKERFGLLLQEFKSAFDMKASTGETRPLLAVVVPTNPKFIEAGYNVDALIKNTDFLHLLTYDYHGSWDVKTGHNSPLYEPDPYGPFGTIFNVNYGALYWVRLGVPRDMLIIGLGLYGRGFKLSDIKQHGIGAPVSGISDGQPFTKEEGYLSYYEVCDKISLGATVVWSDEMQVPYLYRGNLWVGYDNEQSLKNKVKWLKKLGFGGYLVWDMSLDDSRGTFCARGPYPLMKAISQELLDTNSSDPLPPPSYLLDYKCGPCVDKTSQGSILVRDCDPEDPSMYHECEDGLIVYTSSCATIDVSPVFSSTDNACVTNLTLINQVACSQTLNCGQAPEAEFLMSAGYTTEPPDVNMTLATGPTQSSTISTGGGDNTTVTGSAFKPHPSSWMLSVLLPLIMALQPTIRT